MKIPRARHAMVRDTLKFWDGLSERAEQTDKNQLVFTGLTAKLFDELEINPRYYTPIRKILVETGSVEIITRGTKAYPSVWVLHHPPPEPDTWPEDLTGDAVSATMRGEFDRRLRSLEAWRENLTGGGINIPEALRDFEQRIFKLESAVARLKSTSTTAKKGSK